MLPIIFLQLPTVHYRRNSRDSLRCELYTVSTTWLFFAISHLAIIMKSDHHQKQPSSTATPHISTVHYGLQKNVGLQNLLCKMRIFLGTVQHLLGIGIVLLTDRISFSPQ